MPERSSLVAAARIVQDAGGELVGRTRLQKIAYLLELAGMGDQFSFEYRHYGPYSEQLSQAMEIASALGPVVENEKTADWGGRYSIYSLSLEIAPRSPDREEFVQRAKLIDAVELELAATAAFLFVNEGIGRTIEGNPWTETRRRKPGKAEHGRLEKAAAAYERLRKETNAPIPPLPSPA